MIGGEHRGPWVLVAAVSGYVHRTLCPNGLRLRAATQEAIFGGEVLISNEHWGEWSRIQGVLESHNRCDFEDGSVEWIPITRLLPPIHRGVKLPGGLSSVQATGAYESTMRAWSRVNAMQESIRQARKWAAERGIESDSMDKFLADLGELQNEFNVITAYLEGSLTE